MIEAEELMGGIKLMQIKDGAKDIIGKDVEPGVYQLREYTMKYATLHNVSHGKMVSIINYYLEGLKLDDEWLRRFSFDRMENGDYVRVDKNGHWTIKMDEDVPYMVFNTYTKRKLPFVHLLQSLYSTMTGFELHDLEQLIR